MRRFVKRLRSQQGFTLIEMLPTLLLLTMIMTAVYAVATFGMRSYSQINTENRLREEGDIMMSSIITQLYTFTPDRVRQLTDNSGQPAGIRLEKNGDKPESKDIYICGGKLYLGAKVEGIPLQLNIPSCTDSEAAAPVSGGNTAQLSQPASTPESSAVVNTAQSPGIDANQPQWVEAQSRLEEGSIIEIDNREGKSVYESGIIKINLNLSHSIMGGDTAQTSLESKFGF
ncbi:prepilin-type N-terminal cleavage/methylation domain-containing protein [Paenibacillus wulumuqiensis]|uniref:prepilin-type N-terminal cleavage/methylation domain-containing protein n=1 Tax=Paenibacillus wulumuqiensis TaxID=1567107 RepID=UPI0006190E6C|nr:prepilin-type N-terminal cleavage/methylation domain-containing protein [Paenibacillus wulumuqiensis]